MQKMPAPLRFTPPTECLKVDRIPEGELWRYELKLGGYRMIAIKQDSDVQLFSRNGNSFNAKFPSIVQMLETLRIRRFILDGEIVALDERGRHSFGLLQSIKTSKAPLLFYVFDLLHTDKDDLTKRILEKRRRRLESEFSALPKNIQVSPILSGEARRVISHVREFEFEGVVANGSIRSMCPAKHLINGRNKRPKGATIFYLAIISLADMALNNLLSGRNGFLP
jgi:bifunctional non-homologous end joining protein LigD